MGRETRKLTDDIIDLGRLIIVAAIMIVVVFLVIKSLVGDVPAYVGSIVIGLGGVFLYATNKKVREHINNWLSGKK
jgi:Flp pilus assembly protein TadB